MLIAIWIVAALIGLPVVLSMISIVVYRMRWAAFVAPDSRPYPLNLSHDDYPFWPLTLVPRSWTAFLCDHEPRQIAGSNPADHHTDIPADGTWSLTIPFHFAVTTKTRLLFHFGMRRDYQPQGYYNLDLTFKQLSR